MMLSATSGTRMNKIETSESVEKPATADFHFYSQYYENEETIELAKNVKDLTSSRSNKTKQSKVYHKNHHIYIQQEIMYQSSIREENEDELQGEEESNDQSTFDISKFPLLVTSPDRSRRMRKLTSTATTDSFDSSLMYERYPSVSHIPSMALADQSTFNEYEEDEASRYSSNRSNPNSTTSSCFTNSSTTSSATKEKRAPDSFGFHTTDFQTADSKLFENDALERVSVRQSQRSQARSQSKSNKSTEDKDANSDDIYICCLGYQAKSPTELSIEFTDRLKLVQQQEDWDYCLVQNVATKKYGYVPKSCISELNTFLHDLKYLRRGN